MDSAKGFLDSSPEDQAKNLAYFAANFGMDILFDHAKNLSVGSASKMIDSKKPGRTGVSKPGDLVERDPKSGVQARDTRPYDPNRMRSDLECTHRADYVKSTTNPKYPRQRVNSDPSKGIEVIHGVDGGKAVKVDYQSPLTGEPLQANIPYNQRGLPIFDDVAQYSTNIDKAASYRAQMQKATTEIRDGISAGRIDPRQFSREQLIDIQSGSAKIKNFTWHHDADNNSLQLIPAKVHKAVSHIGEAALKEGK